MKLASRGWSWNWIPTLNTIDDLLLKLRQQYDSENLQAGLLTITINRRFVESSQQIKAGDEIALVPRNRTG
jgi:molybdopterin converting factor small subunit